MKKIYILDTCVYLNDAEAMYKFGEHTIVIPFPVLEEIDSKKNEQNELGRNARAFSRYIDALRKQGSLIKGVPVNDEGGMLYVVLYDQTVANCLPYQDMSVMDNRILATARFVMTYSNIIKADQRQVILVTKDTNLRVKADVNDIVAEDYKHGKVKTDDLYTGIKYLTTSQENIDKIYSDSKVSINIFEDIEEELFANECVMFQGYGSKQSAMTRYDSVTKRFYLIPQNSKTMDILPKNVEQQFAFDLLKDTSISLMTMTGKAGSGKTLCALVTGLYQVLESHKYNKVLLLKPIVSMDNAHELGFLPGSMEEKLSPWMASYADNIELIMSGYNKEDKPTRGNTKKDNEAMAVYLEKRAGKTNPIQELFEHGKLEFGSMEHIRGRSLPNQFIIVDECFPASQRVLTKNGKIKLGSMYNNFIKNDKIEDVVTFNEKTKQFELKKVLSVSKKGMRTLVEITSGNKKIKCTEEHPFLTVNGWKKAIELTNNDYVIMHGFNAQNHRWLNDYQQQLVLGSLLGDSSLHIINDNVYRIKNIHSIKQEDYIKYKANILNANIKYIDKNGYSKKPAMSFTTKSFGFPFKLSKNENDIDLIIDNIDERGLAIWYMDDGSKFTTNNGARFHTEGFTYETNVKLSNMLKNKFNIDNKVLSYKEKYNYISLSNAGFITLCKLINKYIHPSMSYKVINYKETEFTPFDDNFMSYSVSVVKTVNILDEQEEVYDIEVKDNHNFIACVGPSISTNTNGFVVHNCQNLSPHAIKTLITRVGEGTKIVLMGDISQIDSPYLDSQSNGLSIIIEKFKNEPIAAHINFKKSERSKLAEIASDILE